MAKIKINREQVESVLKHYSKEESVLVTSDGNVFLTSGTGRSLCADHCKRSAATYATVTRAEFDAGVEEVESPEDKRKVVELKSAPKKAAAPSKDTDAKAAEKAAKEADQLAKFQADWKTGKWNQIVEYAKSLGLEVTTKNTQGKEALIAEVESFIAANAIGANATTDHTA